MELLRNLPGLPDGSPKNGLRFEHVDILEMRAPSGFSVAFCGFIKQREVSFIYQYRVEQVKALLSTAPQFPNNHCLFENSQASPVSRHVRKKAKS